MLMMEDLYQYTPCENYNRLRFVELSMCRSEIPDYIKSFKITNTITMQEKSQEFRAFSQSLDFMKAGKGEILGRFKVPW